MIAVGDVGVTAATMCHEWAQALSDVLELPVDFGRAEPEGIVEAVERAEVRLRLATIAPEPPQPMSSATFVYRADGRPDWSAMWQSFCELALFGGPPHRGEDTALRHLARAAATDAPAFDPVEEIRRGIAETTDLDAAGDASDGWLTVTCDSPKMAAWMAASILLENVDARCDGTRLQVPASPAFRLEDEVKSVVTVVAKVHHYWVQHANGSQPHFRPSAGALER